MSEFVGMKNRVTMAPDVFMDMLAKSNAGSILERSMLISFLMKVFAKVKQVNTAENTVLLSLECLKKATSSQFLYQSVSLSDSLFNTILGEVDDQAYRLRVLKVENGVTETIINHVINISISLGSELFDGLGIGKSLDIEIELPLVWDFVEPANQPISVTDNDPDPVEMNPGITEPQPSKAKIIATPKSTVTTPPAVDATPDVVPVK